MDTKRVTVKATLGEGEGTVQSVFSTFGVIDSDREIVLASALTNGQAVPMTWDHNWAMPIGKGIVTTTQNEAIFDGRFFLSSSWGRDAYETVKAMAELQEWSWGFRVLDARFEEHDGEPVRVITKTDTFEVAPVLRGAGEGTRTLDIKGQKFADAIEALLADAEALRDRTKAHAALRAKDGRVLSRANWERMGTWIDALDGVVNDARALQKATNPDQAADDGKAARIYEARREQLRFLTNRARQMAILGV